MYFEHGVFLKSSGTLQPIMRDQPAKLIESDRQRSSGHGVPHC